MKKFRFTAPSPLTCFRNIYGDMIAVKSGLAGLLSFSNIWADWDL